MPAPFGHHGGGTGNRHHANQHGSQHHGHGNKLCFACGLALHQHPGGKWCAHDSGGSNNNSVKPGANVGGFQQKEKLCFACGLTLRQHPGGKWCTHDSGRNTKPVDAFGGIGLTDSLNSRERELSLHIASLDKKIFNLGAELGRVGGGGGFGGGGTLFGSGGGLFNKGRNQERDKLQADLRAAEEEKSRSERMLAELRGGQHGGIGEDDMAEDGGGAPAQGPDQQTHGNALGQLTVAPLVPFVSNGAAEKAMEDQRNDALERIERESAAVQDRYAEEWEQDGGPEKGVPENPPRLVYKGP